MFRTLALISLLLFGLYWFYIRLRPEDAVFYQKLVQESIDLRHKNALEETPAHQQRQTVQKDIWTQNETRHFQIRSQDSNLTLSQKNEKIEAVEQLKEIECTIQNGFTLTADEGIYTFPSHQFIAQKNCHLKQNQNQIDGTQIHLDLAQEIVTYDNPKGILASGPLHFSAQKLIWDKKAATLHLTNQVRIEQPEAYTLIADLGTVQLDELQPTLVILEGNVRLIASRVQDKESFAIADTLTYNPIQKTLLFSAEKKVLFWQEGLSLSASEILIRQDQSVEGHGDVHFAFDLDEQNFIDELFKQYL
jgi:lipopolysaccharide export system protein LptA